MNMECHLVLMHLEYAYKNVAPRVSGGNRYYTRQKYFYCSICKGRRRTNHKHEEPYKHTEKETHDTVPRIH